MEAVFWIPEIRVRRHMLPQNYPNNDTVHRRMQQWRERQVLRHMFTELPSAPNEQGELDERQGRIDATLVSTKDGKDEIGQNRRGESV